MVELPAALSEGAGLGAELARENPEVDPVGAEEVRLLGLRQELQIVDGRPLPVELVHDERDRRSLFFGVVAEQLEVTAADRQRVPQLVAGILYEFSLAPKDP